MQHKCHHALGQSYVCKTPQHVSLGKQNGWRETKTPNHQIEIPPIIQICNGVKLLLWVFLVAQMVKNLRTTWETWVLSLGGEDPLEEGMATHSSILA